eukprot:TRINITY_DN63827_c0_g1_i1.p1 TRINITY_DN63827_c0_g1~~TRINITY_DN63827_c0_g1_i1.p1  ORF type:complete len:304 (+),score=38.40 TRINITY_DN63827_c0_g1_i1:110-1021(+)
MGTWPSRPQVVSVTALAGLVAGLTVSVAWRRAADDEKRPAPASPKRSKAVSLLHDFDPVSHAKHSAKTPRPALRRMPTGGSRVVRIVLTGGPCAGKSSVLDHLRTKATKKGFDIISAPEVATLILNTGYLFPPSSDQVRLFQTSIAKLQLAMERNLLMLAQATGRSTIVVFDRGILDGKVYLNTQEEWVRIRDQLETSQGGPVDDDYCLSRYDGVIHLVTAADGAEKFYKSGHTFDDAGRAVVRAEDKEQACQLDKKLQDVWSKHPKQIIIKNTPGGFEAKIQASVAAALSIAEDVQPSGLFQ